MFIYAYLRRARILLLTMSAAASLMAQEKIVPVAYDLNVTIEPKAGSLTVRGKIEVPREASGELQFGLHETFKITALSVNGRVAKFTFHPLEPSPITPATRNLLVTLPPDTPPGKVQVDIQYSGTLKQIPEFGTYPDQKQALDDQINSRMVELANYSSWYPQFFPYGRPIQVKLKVSLPRGWIAICSGKKLDENSKSGRTITRWSSPQDSDILITAAPNYKERTVRVPGGQVDIYYTRLPEAFIDKEGADIAAVMDLFTQGFGETTIPPGV